MEPIKRFLSLCLVLVLLVTSVASFAASGGEMLYYYKFISGASDKQMDLMEDQPLTREQLAILITELNGKKSEAAQIGGVPSYADTVRISSWAHPYVAYCESQKWMQGIGFGLFDGKGRVTGRQLALVLLRAMGYDAAWDEVDALLHKLGIPLDDKPLTRGEVFDYIWLVITQPICADGGTLAVKLGRLTSEQIGALRNPSIDLKVDLKDGKYGYVDSTGAIAIPHQFQEAREFIGKIAVVKVQETGLSGMIDRTGRLIYEYDEIATETKMIKIHRKNGTVDEVHVFLVEKDGKRGCVSLDGELVVPLLPYGWEEEYDEKDF